MAPTRQQLEELLGHIRYEIDQLRRAKRLLDDPEWGSEDEERWLVSEAGLVHARNLLDFLRRRRVQTPGGRENNDVLGIDYARRWNPREAERVLRVLDQNPAQLSHGINARVMHLGPSRLTAPLVHFDHVAPLIEKLWSEFVRDLDPVWRDSFPR